MLRNKKTGEVGHLLTSKDIGEYIIINDGYRTLAKYDSLAGLNDEWEDCKDPKEFWFIVQDGDIFSDNDTVTEDYAKRLQAIGNYFESIEEAKKALEKLKAWKRLKDKGFRFEGWNWKAQSIDCSLDYTAITGEQSEEADKDIDLLFGGEE